mmetsp:Transcript_17805/g.17776  ORF Transcript_17805/g.17776 Transcript_17805/m.17776 type:complete len:171 (+) Transcript_17805:30-542(+)
MGTCIGRDDCRTYYKSIYDISIEDIDGNEIKLSTFQNQVLLIVNVATYCGLTDKNYFQLEELYEKYNSKGFNVIAFPCNQFLFQEPREEAKIKAFVKSKGARFILCKKTQINGDKAHDLFKYLRQNSKLRGGRIGWNFGKFLVDKNGDIYNYYSPGTEPEAIKPDIERLI